MLADQANDKAPTINSCRGKAERYASPGRQQQLVDLQANLPEFDALNWAAVVETAAPRPSSADADVVGATISCDLPP